MLFRFFRRIRIAPGLTLNLSKGGVSVSAGPRGAQCTVGTRDNRTTVGVPGTGLFHTVFDPLGKATAATAAWPSLNVFQRLAASSEELAFIDALAALRDGRDGDALPLLETASRGQSQAADAAWMAGITAFKLERMDVAQRHFELAPQQGHALGQWFARQGLTPRIARARLWPERDLPPVMTAARIIRKDAKNSVPGF